MPPIRSRHFLRFTLDIALALLMGFLVCNACGTSDSVLPSMQTLEGLETEGWNGKFPGVHSWELMRTPDGMRPTQSWHALASSPEGDIYVAGMDHLKNSALYRLDLGTGVLRYVGDARAAAESAGNFESGDLFEKFHTKPTWYKGRMYLANLNRSYGNDEWRGVRGFHWFAYDIKQDRFLDLSAQEPGGVAVAHGGLVSLVSDIPRGLLYGVQEPEGRLYRYEMDSGKTVDLGRPLGLAQTYVYATRAPWVDAQGRVYLTMGKAWYNRGEDDLAVTNHVHVYEPGIGWTERKDWKLAPPVAGGVYDAIEVGQWTLDRKSFFMADDRMRIYRFDEAGPSFIYIGRAEYGGGDNWVWQVAPNGKKAYFVPSDPAEGLFEYDFEKFSTRKLSSLGDLDERVEELTRHTGYDAWDAEGRFYFASFNRKANRNVLLTAVDPVRWKVARHDLPALQRVEVRRQGNGFLISRLGGTQGEIEVVYRISGEDPLLGICESTFGRSKIAEGQSSVVISATQWSEKCRGKEALCLQVIADGDTYVLGDPAYRRACVSQRALEGDIVRSGFKP